MTGMNDFYKAKHTGVADMANPAQVDGLIARQNQEHADARAKRDREAGEATKTGANSPLYIWFFGLIGALFFGVNPIAGTDAFVSAVLGFVGAGFAAGVLAKFTIGKIILAVVGVGFAALIGYAILFAAQ